MLEREEDGVLTNKRKSATRDGRHDEREEEQQRTSTNYQELPKKLVKTTQGLRRKRRDRDLLCFLMHDETPRDRPKITYEVCRNTSYASRLPEFQSSAYRNRSASSVTLAVPKKQNPQTFFPVSSTFPRLRLSCRTKGTAEWAFFFLLSHFPMNSP